MSQSSDRAQTNGQRADGVTDNFSFYIGDERYMCACIRMFIHTIQLIAIKLCRIVVHKLGNRSYENACLGPRLCEGRFYSRASCWYPGVSEAISIDSAENRVKYRFEYSNILLLLLLLCARLLKWSNTGKLPIKPFVLKAQIT